MNELKISITDPYTGKEAMPVKDEQKIIYDTLCITPLNTQTIERVPSNNEKGYKFQTRPCYCFQVGNYQKKTSNINELFDYEELNEMKRHILHNDYSLCKGICKLYETHKNGSKISFSNWKYFIETYGVWARDLFFAYDKVDTYPLYNIALNISPVCNYKCKTCRDEMIVDEIPMTDEDFNYLVNIIKSVKSLSIGCDGETFLSKIYMKLLSMDLTENSNLEDVKIFTNGSLANETNLKKIHKNNWKIINEFRISIDAATKEVYSKVRNAHTWNAVIDNIKNLNALGKIYDFKLMTVFTISKYNVCDVFDFADFAVKLGFVEVGFSFAMKRFHGMDEDFFIPENKRQDIIEYVNDLSKNNPYKCNIALM